MATRSEEREPFGGSTLEERWPICATVIVFVNDLRYKGVRLRGLVAGHRAPSNVFVTFSGRETYDIDGLLLAELTTSGVHERYLYRVDLE